MATQIEIADHLGIGERHVRRLVARGVLPPSKGAGGLDLDRCRLAYIAHLRGVASNQVASGEDLDLPAERAKLARAQTAFQEHRNAEARASLIPPDAVRERWAEEKARARGHVLAIPGRFKALRRETTRAELRVLTRMLERALAELQGDGIPPAAVKD